VIAAAAAAGVVLVGGLLWPSEPSASDSRAEDAERAVAEPLRGSHSETEVSQRAESGSATEDEAGDDAEPAPTPSGESTDAAEPVEAARDLLTAIRDCAAAGDRVCAEAVTGGAAGHIDEWGSMVQGTGWEDGVSLVDSYGDVAVLRLSSTSEGGDAEAVEPAQMIVLIRQNDKWLVRDVYAVADQPG